MSTRLDRIKQREVSRARIYHPRWNRHSAYKYGHRPESDFPGQTGNEWRRYQVRPEDRRTTNPASRLEQQFRDNPPTRPRRINPKWIYRPRPKDKEDEEEPKVPFPPFPDEVPDTGIPEPDLDIPGQDIVVDDPFSPIDESEEAEDEGEDVKDPGRDQFPVPPMDECVSTYEESILTGLPLCQSSNASIHIETSKKFRAPRSYGPTNHKSSLRYKPGQKDPFAKRSHSRRHFSGLRQSNKYQPSRVHGGSGRGGR